MHLFSNVKCELEVSSFEYLTIVQNGVKNRSSNTQDDRPGLGFLTFSTRGEDNAAVEMGGPGRVQIRLSTSNTQQDQRVTPIQPAIVPLSQRYQQSQPASQEYSPTWTVPTPKQDDPYHIEVVASPRSGPKISRAAELAFEFVSATSYCSNDFSRGEGGGENSPSN